MNKPCTLKQAVDMMTRNAFYESKASDALAQVLGDWWNLPPLKAAIEILVLAPPLADDITRDQQQLSDLIRVENVRLSRLIINLYLKFTLETSLDEDVYYSVCHSIAEYFHADCCELLLLHRERERENQSETIGTWLQLYGAFGAWEKALNSLFVRRRVPIRYDVPTWEDRKNERLGNTRHLWLSGDPVAFPHRGHWKRGGDDPSTNSELENIPHQLAWLNYGLATTCRNILGGPLQARNVIGAPQQKFLNDGVIKVENRRPLSLKAFCLGHEGELLLRELWRCAAVRPYVRYLKRKPDPHESRQNEVGWQRRYSELQERIDLFWDLRDWYGTESDSEKRQQVLDDLSGQFVHLVDFATHAETFLQHVRHTLHLIVNLRKATHGQDPAQILDFLGPPLDPHNIPSLFNIENICGRWYWLLSPDRDRPQTPGSWIQKDLTRFATVFEKWAKVDELRSSRDAERVVDNLKNQLLKSFQWTEKEPKGNLSEVLSGSLRQRTKPNGSEPENYQERNRGVDYVAACHLILRELQELAERLKEFQSSADAKDQFSLLGEQEYRRLRRCAEETWDLAERSLSNNITATDPNQAVKAALDAVADTLAAAAMHSHTFSKADETRMLFISRRVAQLLDNRIIALAQSRGIPVSHRDIAMLKIDEFALENLERIHLAAQTVGQLITRAIQWWVGCHYGSPLPELHLDGLDLRDLLKTAGRLACPNAVNETIAPHKSHRFQLLLVRARLPGAVRAAEMSRVFNEFSKKEVVTVKGETWSVGVRPAQYSELAALKVEVIMGRKPHEYEGSDWLFTVARNVEDLKKQLENWLNTNSSGETCKFQASAPHTTRDKDFGDRPRPGIPPIDSKTSGDAQALTQLRKKLDALIAWASAAESSKSGDFFDLLDRKEDNTGQTPGPLSDLCDSISNMVRCNSCALFFKDSSTEVMRMRGASGNLWRTLCEWRKKQKSESAKVSGIAYPSRWRTEYEHKSRGELESLIRNATAAERWPLTNQIWHLGEGRVASSRQEFFHASLRQPDDKGWGDKFAYPPEVSGNANDSRWTLRNVFRSFVGTPIFTRGGRTEYVPKRDDPWWSKAKPDATRSEFHGAYRVVGILKVEGKLPRMKLSEARIEDWWPRLSIYAKEKLIRVIGRGDLSDAQEKSAKVLEQLYNEDKDITGLGRKLLEAEGAVDTKFVDALTEALDARWDPSEDIELLVAIAMELGRLLTLRTLRAATDKGIVLGENDVGLLDIRTHHIDEIKLLDDAADVVTAKVAHELRQIQTALEEEQRKELRQVRPGEPDPHKIIESIDPRKKDLVSLFKKLILKEVSRTRDNTSVRLGPNEDDRFLHIADWTDLASMDRVLSGWSTLVVHRDGAGNGKADLVGADLRYGEKGMKFSERENARLADDAPFGLRILSRGGYGITDWAGVRVVCTFLSDIDKLVDAIRAAFADCGIELQREEIESWREFAQSDGYRGVHLNVRVPLKGVIPKEKHELILRLLKQSPGDAGLLVRHNGTEEVALFPCEIQLRTAYEHSWARASHQIAYKRKGIRDDRRLREHMHSLSSMLFVSDRIMDLVRETIESGNSKHVELLQTLRGRLPEGSFMLVCFAAELARAIHRDNRMYDGRQHYEHLLEAADRLVRSFGVDDPLMLVLAFFHDLWMDDAGKVLEKLEVQQENLTSKSIDMKILEQLRARFDSQKTTPVLSRLRRHLPTNWPLHLPTGNRTPEGPLPPWFGALLAIFLKAWHPKCKDRIDLRMTLLEAKIGEMRDCRDKWRSELNNFQNRILTLRKSKLSRDKKTIAQLEQHAQGIRGQIEELTETMRQVERRGCVIETAVQLSRLSELPGDPHGPRAVQDLRDIYLLLEKIRRRLGDDMRPVLREAEKALRSTADKLKEYLPIDWEA